MKVALYASQLAPQGGTGIHRYVAELVQALFARYPGRYRLVASAENGDPSWLPAPVMRLPGPRRILHLAWYLTRRPRIDWFVRDAGLFHVLYPSFPVPVRRPLVYTFHDIQQIENPAEFGRRESRLGAAAIRDAVDRAERIITVSASVAEAAVAHLGVERRRLTVVHLGVSERFRKAPSSQSVVAACSRFGVEPGRYFIYVGKVDVRKNVTTLVKALARRGPGARLLVAGPAGLGGEQVLAEVERSGLSADVVMAGFVPDVDLPALMSGALALVHPSTFEGFGLTPLEAMSLGTPAIASSAGSLPEVLGDAALLMDPSDPDAWAGAMTKVEQDPDFAAGLAERGRAHASSFTWERTAQQTAAVHESILAR